MAGLIGLIGLIGLVNLVGLVSLAHWSGIPGFRLSGGGVLAEFTCRLGTDCRGATSETPTRPLAALGRCLRLLPSMGVRDGILVGSPRWSFVLISADAA